MIRRRIAGKIESSNIRYNSQELNEKLLSVAVSGIPRLEKWARGRFLIKVLEAVYSTPGGEGGTATRLGPQNALDMLVLGASLRS